MRGVAGLGEKIPWLPDYNNQKIILLIIFAFQEPGRLSHLFLPRQSLQTSKLAFALSKSFDILSHLFSLYQAWQNIETRFCFFSGLVFHVRARF